jgi:hypothetical protein
MEDHLLRGRVLEGLQSKEGKSLLACLMDYLVEKWYILGVVLG